MRSSDSQPTWRAQLQRTPRVEVQELPWACAGPAAYWQIISCQAASAWLGMYRSLKNHHRQHAHRFAPGNMRIVHKLGPLMVSNELSDQVASPSGPGLSDVT